MQISLLRNLVVALIAVGAFMASSPNDAVAQRYLTEFVGTSKVSRSTAQQFKLQAASTPEIAGEDSVTLPSRLTFTELKGRRLKGRFSFEQGAGTETRETERFSLTGDLFPTGECIVDLKQGENTGDLDLLETNFDGERKVFALIGTLGVAQDTGKVVLSNGPLSGRSAFFRPPSPMIRVPAGTRQVTLVSGTDSRSATTSVTLASAGRGKVVSGTLVLPSTGETLDVIGAASKKWLYLVGVGTTSFFTAKVSVVRSSEGLVQAGPGTYKVLNTGGAVLDSGSITVGAL